MQYIVHTKYTLSNTHICSTDEQRPQFSIDHGIFSRTVQFTTEFPIFCEIIVVCASMMTKLSKIHLVTTEITVT